MTELELACQEWKDAKWAEDHAKCKKHECEEKIARLKNLETGTNTFHGLKATVGNKEEFNEVPSDLLDKFFTTSIVYKPNTKAIKLLQSEQPDEWKKLQKFQTLTPKKTAFTVVKEGK